MEQLLKGIASLCTLTQMRRVTKTLRKFSIKAPANYKTSIKSLHGDLHSIN